MILNRQDTKNIKILDSKRERTEVVHMQYSVVNVIYAKRRRRIAFLQFKVGSVGTAFLLSAIENTTTLCA